jgi:hypothetical protein
MIIPPELAADYASTTRLLNKALKDGEYHCRKPGCGFKDPSSLKFLEHIAGHVNDFCKSKGMPLIEVVVFDGSPDS